MGIFRPEFNVGEDVYLSRKGYHERVRAKVAESGIRVSRSDFLIHRYYRCFYVDSKGRNRVVGRVREEHLSRIESES